MKKRKKEKSLANTILYIASALIIVFTFMYCINMKNNRGIFGYTARIVVSGSMEPTIKINTVNIIKTCDADDVEVGDIICYRYDKDIIHRVIDKKVDDNGEIVINTQGDANKLPDGVEITDDMVIGKVVCTMNWSRVIVSRFSMEPGKLDGVELIKVILKYILLLAICLYLAKRLVLLMSLTYKAFVKKENYIEGINELDDRLLELSKTTNEDIKFHKVEVKNTSRTRIHYIINKILKARSDFLVKNLISDIDSFNRDFNTLIKIDQLIKKLDGEVVSEDDSKKSISKTEDDNKTQETKDNKGIGFTDAGPSNTASSELQDITEKLDEIKNTLATMQADAESKEDKQ